MREGARNSRDRTFTSARNLLGILRLATALARLRLADEVEKDDVIEANRLLAMSKHSINCSEQTSSGTRGDQNIKRIFEMIKEISGSTKTVKLSDIMERCTNKGFRADQVRDVIEEYEQLNIWQVNQARTKITFL